MEVDIYHPGLYHLRQLGSRKMQPFQLSSRFPAKNAHYHGAHWRDVIVALIDRTWFANKILPCNETPTAARLMEQAIGEYRATRVHVLDEGHVYEFGNGKPANRQVLTFVKRSSKAVQYPKEWPGTQSQEVMRMLIYHVAEERANRREEFSLEGFAPEEYLQHAIYQYEARAYRRHTQRVNREKEPHEALSDGKDLRDYGHYLDVPFEPDYVDLLPTRDDGHVFMPNGRRCFRNEIDVMLELLG